MKLNAAHIRKLEEAIEMELECQRNLARARVAASEQLVEHFEADNSDADPEQIKLAIQFTARPSHPLQALIRITARAEATKAAKQPQDRHQHHVDPAIRSVLPDINPQLDLRDLDHSRQHPRE